MTPIDKLRRRALGAVHDHRQVYLDPQAVLDLIERAEKQRAALAWLVRLKDDPPSDYEAQKLLAWDAARAALGGGNG